MEKKRKQDQVVQTHMNDYERSKMLRVQENKKKLLELGVKNISKSLTNLVESKKPKKKNEKLAAWATNKRDIEYTTDISDHGEGNFEKRVTKSVGVSKKQNRPQYIAPRSINKYANITKKRVVAQNVSSKFPLQEGCQQNEYFNDTNATKKIRLQLHEKGPEQNGQTIDKSSATLTHSRAKVTLGELIRNNKGSQIREGALKRTLDNPNPISKNMSGGIRRKLFLVDKDDDFEDNAISQDVTEIYREEDDVQYDVNEDLEDMLYRNIQNGNHGDYVRNRDNEYDDDDDDDDDDDENVDTEHIYDNVENGIERDDHDNDIENEGYGLVNEQHETPQSVKEAAVTSTKKRGPTMMHGIQVRKFKDREVIICNEYGQPIGRVTDERDTVGQFSRFLGTIARNYRYAPLIFNSWHKVPNKDRMWEYVSEKYCVPDNAKDWVLKSIGACWKGYKCRIKKKRFYEIKDNKSRWKSRPMSIPVNDFAELLRLWNKKEVMRNCLRARDIRMYQKNMHTTGPISFARIREKLKNEDPDNESPSLTKMFEHTRKRTEGNIYVDTYDDTAEKINYKPSEEVEDVGARVDPFLRVMSKEYNGHRRLFGRGVSNKLIKKMNDGETSCVVSREIEKSMKTIESEKEELVRRKKELDEEHEKNMVELAEEHEREKVELEAMKDKIVEDAVRKIMEKIPPGVAREIFS